MDTISHTTTALPALADRAQRYDGWTPDRQRTFLEAIAEGHTVGSACALVGMAPSSATAPASRQERTRWNRRRRRPVQSQRASRRHSAQRKRSDAMAGYGWIALAWLAIPLPASAQMDPVVTGQGQVLSGTMRGYAERDAAGPHHSAPSSVTPRQAAACAQKARFRQQYGADNPKVQKLYRLCRGIGR